MVHRQLPHLSHAPNPSLVRLVVVVVAFAAALFAGACAETRLNRALTPPDQVQTLDHRSAYLKVHMKDGRLYRTIEVAR